MVSGSRRAASRSNEATREKILACAEVLFMEQGFSATTLRAITSLARVNLAAVNYHFGSKDGLVREVLSRRLGPLNDARLAALDQLELAARGRPLPVERILEALLLPALRVSRDPLRDGATALRLLGRAFSEPVEYMGSFLPDQYHRVAARFQQALRGALPDLPEAELVWRMHFAFGAIAYTMAGNDALRLVARCEAEASDDPDAIVRRLVPFLASGFRAPSGAAAPESGQSGPGQRQAA